MQLLLLPLDLHVLHRAGSTRMAVLPGDTTATSISSGHHRVKQTIGYDGLRMSLVVSLPVQT